MGTYPHHPAVDQINREFRCKYWVTRSSICSFARTTTSFTYSEMSASLERTAALIVHSLTHSRGHWKYECLDLSQFQPKVQAHHHVLIIFILSRNLQVLWLYGDDHQLTEVGTMNVFMFWINDDGEKELVTPPLEMGVILPGVTRQSLLDLANEMGGFKVGLSCGFACSVR